MSQFKFYTPVAFFERPNRRAYLPCLSKDCLGTEAKNAGRSRQTMANILPHRMQQRQNEPRALI